VSGSNPGTVKGNRGGLRGRGVGRKSTGIPVAQQSLGAPRRKLSEGVIRKRRLSWREEREAIQTTPGVTEKTFGGSQRRGNCHTKSIQGNRPHYDRDRSPELDHWEV